MTTGPAEPLLAPRVRKLLGASVRFEERTAPFAEARVWAVLQDDAVVAWLKLHAHDGKRHRERRAYTRWLSQVSAPVPELLAAWKEPPALLVRHVPGVRADQARLEGDTVTAVYRAIGRFAAELHAVPFEDLDPVPLPEALRHRCASWLARAGDRVEPEVHEALEAWWDEPIPAVRRVPCHRDLQLRNVVVDGVGADASVVVIDFGQARPDCWLTDVVKLFQRPDSLARGAWPSFFEGYGRRLSPDEVELLARMRALHGLATRIWAIDHGDPRAASLGEQILMDAIEPRLGDGR